jgi:two-component system phosphate regulon sensor histidine kinase PhoR
MAARSSLAIRLTFVLVVVTLLAMAAMGFYITRALETHAVRDLKADLETHARLIHNDLAPLLVSGDKVKQIQELAKHYRVKLGGRVTVIAFNGRVLGESELDVGGVLAMENHAARPEIRAALAGTVGSEVRPSETLDIDMLYVAIPIQVGDRVQGALRLAVPMPEVARTIGWIRGTVMAGALLATGLAVAVGIFIGRRITRPVAEMQAIAERMADGQFDQTVSIKGADEIADLGSAINRMALSFRGKVERLEGERAKVTAVLDSMSQGVIAVDDAGRILLMNPAARDIFSLGMGSVESRPLLAVIRETALLDLVEEAQSRLLGECFRRKLELGPPISRVLEVYVGSLKLASNGTGTLLVFNDVTGLRGGSK